MTVTTTQRIRSSGAHLKTIGKELIQDKNAAIIELVKNAYDADSPDVSISFRRLPNENYQVIIEDHGHGMSTDTVLNKWLVLSTTDKVQRRTSPGGRKMQGRKGIGRFSAFILGDSVYLETVTATGEMTSLFLDWRSFQSAEYLEDVEILVETAQSLKGSGTTIIVTGDKNDYAEWNRRAVDDLRFELKKLVYGESSQQNGSTGSAGFQVMLNLDDFFDGELGFDTIEEIVPFPIQEFFDYRISGTVDQSGLCSLKYENRKIRNSVVESLAFPSRFGGGFGEISIDLRVFDRDRDSLDQLIGRGLKDNFGNSLARDDARRLLDHVNGVSVFRNGFRIRPLGDHDFDWLRLNETRIQNPSKRISSNQVVGTIEIGAEDISGLVEKSARDGLRENVPYNQLKVTVLEILGKLEDRRYESKKRSGQVTDQVRLTKTLDELEDNKTVIAGIRSQLQASNIEGDIIEKVVTELDRDQTEKTKKFEQVRNAIAVYQVQATMGRIVEVILHEGRRPLGYLKNQLPSLQKWIERFLTKGDSDAIPEIKEISTGLARNADIFVRLFNRLDPLSAGRRTPRTPIELKRELREVFGLFENYEGAQDVLLEVDCGDQQKLDFQKQDFWAVFANLFENSCYWISKSQSEVRKINVSLTKVDEAVIEIHYIDSGPGIEPALIDSGVIFEPNYSTKVPNGSGLGLAIAGEAAARNGFQLGALASDSGVHFVFLREAGGIQ